MPERSVDHGTDARRVGGRYRLLHELGSGGMATVFRAHDDVLDRDVAIKLLHHHLAGDPAFLERFRREARAAAALSHPNVVGVHDWGEADQAAFLVLQLVDGPSLRDVLRDRGRLTPVEAASALLPAAAGIGSAHRAGYVHCDVKPENLLIGDDGVLQVTDFGLARAAATATSTFGDGVLIGSPHYLSPEAVRGEPLTAAADVYALGIVLYEALVGAPPHTGESPYATAMAHTATPVPQVSRHAPEVTVELGDVVARATARDPAHRYADANELHAALARAVPEAIGAPVPTMRVPRVGSTRAGVHGPDSNGPDSHGPESHTAVVEADHTTRVTAPTVGHRGWLVWLIATLLIAASLAGGGYLLWDRVIAPVTAIPTVVGLSESQAVDELADAGFNAVVAEQRPHDLESEAGDVLAQQPTGEARTGTGVELTVSAGPRQIEIPPLEGSAEDEAVAELDARGLEAVIERSYDDEVPTGRVLGSDPGPEVMVDEASEVTLTISRGPRPIEVPELIGEPLGDARTRVNELDLSLEVGGRQFDDAPVGTVLAQDPAPGGELTRGEVITVEVSDGPEPIEVPNVRGEQVADAVATLESLGFEVEIDRRGGFSAFLDPGRVYDQDPAPQSTRYADDVIRLYANEG